MKKRYENKQTRHIRIIDIIGISIVGLILLMLWVVCLGYLVSGNYFGHRNYYGQPVGTLLLLVMLIITTPIYIFMTIKTLKERKVKLSSPPKWMSKPPWKWPWE